MDTGDGRCLAICGFPLPNSDFTGSLFGRVCHPLQPPALQSHHLWHNLKTNHNYFFSSIPIVGHYFLFAHAADLQMTIVSLGLFFLFSVRLCSGCDEEQIATALGCVCHVAFLISKYLEVRATFLFCFSSCLFLINCLFVCLFVPIMQQQEISLSVM